MIKLIDSLLQDNTRVILPEFGAILKNPDTGELSFNQFLYFNDNFLIDALCQVEKIDHKEASSRIEEFVKKIQKSLDTNKSFEMGSLGKFIKEEDGTINIISKEASKPGMVTEEPEAKAEEKTEDAKKDESESKVQEDLEVAQEDKKPEDQTEISEPEPEKKSATTAEIELDEKEQVTQDAGMEEISEASEETGESMADVVNIDLDAEQEKEEERQEKDEKKEDKEKEQRSTTQEEYPFPESHLHTAPGSPQEPPPGNNKRNNLGWWIGGGLLAGLIVVVVILYFLKPESFEFIFNRQKVEVISKEPAEDSQREDLMPAEETVTEETESSEGPVPTEESSETTDKEPTQTIDQAGNTAPHTKKSIPEAKPADYPQQDKYFIVAGVFQHKDLAEDYVNTLRQLDYGSEIFAARKGMYAVSFNKYDRLSDALEELEKIRANVEPEAWVLHH